MKQPYNVIILNTQLGQAEITAGGQVEIKVPVDPELGELTKEYLSRLGNRGVSDNCRDELALAIYHVFDCEALKTLVVKHI